MNSSKDTLDEVIGIPEMMAFMILVGTDITKGQLIKGIFF